MKALRLIRYEPTMNGHLTISPTGSLVSYDDYEALLASHNSLCEAMNTLLVYEEPTLPTRDERARWQAVKDALRNAGAEDGGGE